MVTDQDIFKGKGQRKKIVSASSSFVTNYTLSVREPVTCWKYC